MAKTIFISLPVNDVDRSTAFYQAIGLTGNAQFSDHATSCLVFSDTIQVMLMTSDKYRHFTRKEIADPKTTSLALLCLFVDSRQAVDDMIGRPRRPAAISIHRRWTISTSCMAAASRIPTATCGACRGWMPRPRRRRWPHRRPPDRQFTFSRHTESDSITTLQIAA